MPSQNTNNTAANNNDRGRPANIAFTATSVEQRTDKNNAPYLYAKGQMARKNGESAERTVMVFGEERVNRLQGDLVVGEQIRLFGRFSGGSFEAFTLGNEPKAKAA